MAPPPHEGPPGRNSIRSFVQHPRKVEEQIRHWNGLWQGDINAPARADYGDATERDHYCDEIMTAESALRPQPVRRSARLRPPPGPAGSVTVPPPPSQDAGQAGLIGWLQYLFPVVGSLGAMLFIFNNPKPLYVASALLFMLGSVGMGVGMGAQQRMSTRRRAQGARERYLEHLQSLRTELRRKAETQRSASVWRHPAPDSLLALTATQSRLWERRAGDTDFLQLRVGTGSRRLATPISAPPSDATGPPADPVCAAAADALIKVHGLVEDDVISIGLSDSRVVCVAGP